VSNPIGKTDGKYCSYTILIAEKIEREKLRHAKQVTEKSG